MRRHTLIETALAICAVSLFCGSDWGFRPSYYTHDPATGQRVSQYAQPAPSYGLAASNYQQSGYRHNTTSIRGPNGSDHMHIVETWGDGANIRPYGEWLYPYRAGATPYGPWGNPQGPWTLPFDSWMNPYGLMQPRGYPMPYAQLPPGMMHQGGMPGMGQGMGPGGPQPMMPPAGPGGPGARPFQHKGPGPAPGPAPYGNGGM